MKSLLSAFALLSVSVSTLGCLGDLEFPSDRERTTPIDTRRNFGPDPVGEAGGKCNDKQGAPDPVTKMGDIQARVVGRWLFCGRSRNDDKGPFANELAIEFTGDGVWHYLREMPGSGRVIAEVGSGMSGKWDQVGAQEGDENVIYLREWSGKLISTLRLNFETNPRSWSETQSSGPVPLRAVPIEQDD